MNIIESIKTILQRLLGATTQELTALEHRVYEYTESKFQNAHTRIDMLESAYIEPIVQAFHSEIATLKEDIAGLNDATRLLIKENSELRKVSEERFADHYALIKYLQATKRDAAGLRGDVPESLK